MSAYTHFTQEASHAQLFSSTTRLSPVSSNELFLLALRNVAEAHGMKKLAVTSQLNRESMYRMLSEQGNPQLSSLTTILKQLGLKLAVEVEESVAA